MSFDPPQEGKGILSRTDLEKIIMSLLKDECYDAFQSQELLADIFIDLNLKKGNVIDKREFLIGCSQSETLTAIMVAAAEKEKAKRKKAKKEKAETELMAALENAGIGAEGGGEEDEGKKKDKKKKKKKRRKKDPLEKYISITPSGSRRGSHTREGSPTSFTRMSRRGSLFC